MLSLTPSSLHSSPPATSTIPKRRSIIIIITVFALSLSIVVVVVVVLSQIFIGPSLPCIYHIDREKHASFFLLFLPSSHINR